MYLQRREDQLSTPFGEVSICAWENEEFAVGLYAFQGYARLSIWRQPGTEVDEVMSWEELQKIKSLCGYGHLDAVEVYPRDQDVVNTTNARHLYIMADPLPFAMRFKPPVILKSNPSEKGDDNGAS